MTRTVLRYVRWHVVPDNEPDAEPWIYAMECAVCGQRPPAGADFAEPQSWTLQHSGHNPDHHSYREILTLADLDGAHGVSSASPSPGRART